ncbi:hypothetical protein D3C81_1365830 [compost metagenome]
MQGHRWTTAIGEIETHQRVGILGLDRVHAHTQFADEACRVGADLIDARRQGMRQSDLALQGQRLGQGEGAGDARGSNLGGAP